MINVLVATNQALLGDLLVDLLAQDDSLQPSRLAPPELENLLQLLDGFHVNTPVIILDEALLTDALCEKTRQMGKEGRLQLIIVSLARNEILICQSRQVVLTGVADLLLPIHGFGQELLEGPSGGSL
jgi:chemotaxis response regulator CheB